jgi:hypothetical protein
VTSLLIALTCLIAALVTWTSVAYLWVIKELRWLHNVLVPWMDSIHNEIQGKPDDTASK